VDYDCIVQYQTDTALVLKKYCCFAGLEPEKTKKTWFSKQEPYMVAQLTYGDCDDDKGDVHGSRVEEGAAIGDIDARARIPLAHFD